MAPGLYEFPYPVALYLVAAPFSLPLSTPSEYVPLLRIIAATVDTGAGILLYYVLIRAWGDRLAGAVAVALYHLIPLDFRVLAIANLTNAFGQSLSVFALASVTLGAPRHQTLVRRLGAVALVTTAFLSHTSTFAILLVALFAIGLGYRALGGPVLRAAARDVWSVAGAAALLSIAIYYAHFGDVYRAQLTRIASEVVGGAAGVPDPAARTFADRIAIVPEALGAYLRLARVDPLAGRRCAALAWRRPGPAGSRAGRVGGRVPVVSGRRSADAGGHALLSGCHPGGRPHRGDRCGSGLAGRWLPARAGGRAPGVGRLGRCPSVDRVDRVTRH